MNCPSCQSPLPPAARFCGVCGHQITSPVTPQPQPVIRPPTNQPPPGAPGGRALPKPLGGPIGRARTKEGDPFIGQVLNGRFKIESKLGEGGFGAVYKGVQVATSRKVALKLLHPEMTRDDNLVARFRREGLVLCNLRDPHTITTYDFDSTPDGTLYIAMELLEGKSLHQVFHSEAPIAWQRVLKIASQVASSLGEAHQQGIVHRDLKPENIYLENRGGDPEFVKILDFGIAKVMRGENTVDPGAPQLTATGQTLGTLEYMSPEQLMGKQLDGRSDVYAIGVLCYELLTGRLPFPDAKGPAALITAQLKQTPKPPSQANPNGNIPSGVDRIVLKMLEKAKDSRFSDVTALAHAAQECLAQGGSWGTDPAMQAPAAAAARRGNPALAETKRGDPMNLGAPPSVPVVASPGDRSSPSSPSLQPGMGQPMGPGAPMSGMPMGGPPPMQPHPNMGPGPMLGGPPPMQPHPNMGPGPMYGGPGGSAQMPPYGAAPGPVQAKKSPIVLIVVGVLVVAAVVGGVLAFVL